MNSRDIRLSDNNYLKYENKYKKYFEKFFLSNIELKDYEKMIAENELGFEKVSFKIPLKSELEEYLESDYFYVLNEFYIEKLSNKELEILKNGNDEEIRKLIEKTYKEIIKYTNEKNDRVLINYTFSTSLNDYSYNDELAIAIYYSKNIKKDGTEEEFFQDLEIEQTFFYDLIERLRNEVMLKLDICSKIILRYT